MIEALPTINASLNALSAVLLAAGFANIRRRRIAAHKACMLGACASSAVFLACYLFYHYHHGATRYQGTGALRAVYFSILLTHTLLAVVNLPMILVTLWRAFKGDFERHKRIARWTFGVWMYVSVTGVAVYWMLYRM